MRFTSTTLGEDGQPVLVAYALPNYDRGQTLFFELFSCREALPLTEYTLENGETREKIVLPEECVRTPGPRHFTGQSVRKVS